MKQILMILALLAGCSMKAQNTYQEWVAESVKLIENNRLDSAASALQNAMSLEPANENNPMLLLNLGVLQRRLHRYDDAYISLTAALAANPDPESVLHNRAALLCELGRFDEAIEDYDSILLKSPQNTEAYYRRGLLYLEKGDRKKTESDFKTAQNIDENSLFSKLGMALLYKMDGDWPEAAKIYSGIIENEPKPASVFYLDRAECYVNTGQFSKAAADLRAIEKEERENPFYYILLGRVRLNQYDNFAAKADFEKAKKLGYDAALADKWIEKTE